MSARESGGMRPASEVMTLRRAGVAVPTALAFSRSALRELVRGHWRIEKLRFDLDAEGRGEVLYRFTDGRWTFHFFLVALKLDEAQKMDRNWAQSWDAMGVLCQGEWTPEREALLRQEVPKQRNGYADYGTLVYARGNRSARFFDHVVDRLAAGRQPDAALLARIGYILRTTAFIANGQLGTCAWAGLEPDHPLRRPYHAQMCSAWLLREYVFDLVEHVARAKNPRAARLDPAYRRFLGLGNAAATGLISFIVNHPHLVHRWSEARESALAEALGRAPDEQRFLALLDRAIRYHREASDERTDLFATASRIADELAEFKANFPEEKLESWDQIPNGRLGAEAHEIVLSLILELYPDITAARADAFAADERCETRPGMTAAKLRALLDRHYDWALTPEYAEAADRYFWYRAVPTPRENRRGLRSIASGLQRENGLDTTRRIHALRRQLDAVPDDLSTAEFLAAQPELRHIVARVQTLAGSDYADLRVNWLAQDFSPFEPVRLLCALYGMEKFEAARPKSVRGAFLQGAPIAEDVAAGRDGVWPFPLIPQASGDTLLQPLPPAGLGAVRNPQRAAPRTQLRIAPAELERTVRTALQGHGATLGLAEEAAAIVAFAHAMGEPALAEMLRLCDAGLAPGGMAMDSAAGVLDAKGMAAILAAPTALDLACEANAIKVKNSSGAVMLGQLALRCAERGLVGLVQWPGGYAIAGPGSDGPWYAAAAGSPPEHALQLEAGDFAITCLEGPVDSAAWLGVGLRNRVRAWQQEGLTIAVSELEALERAAAKLLVPNEEVPRLRPGEDSDPLKMF